MKYCRKRYGALEARTTSFRSAQAHAKPRRTKKAHGAIPCDCISSEPTHLPTQPTGLANLRSQKSHHTNPIIVFDPGYSRPPFQQSRPKSRDPPFVYLPPLSRITVKRPTQNEKRARLCRIRRASSAFYSPRPSSVASQPTRNHTHRTPSRFCHTDAMPDNA